MFNKRLLSEFKENKILVVGMVITQWLSLLANVLLIYTMSDFIMKVFNRQVESKDIYILAITAITVMAVRTVMNSLNSSLSFKASTGVKKRLRQMIFEKLMRLGSGYKEKLQTAEAVQITTEGVEQLEIYFAKYIPQFFYSLLAPLTLFLIVGRMSLKVAVVLLICVPLIPVSIVAVQKFAKKMLSKYWGTYTELGDSFLESIQALTTLKIYQADERYAKKMDDEAEKFRKITMKVLIMQLNSVSIMDMIAYGGAALGIILTVLEWQAAGIDLAQSIFIIMVSAEFFLPLRLLGSFFHIAMNGNAAADKIFKLLDCEEIQDTENVNWNMGDIVCENVSYTYPDKEDAVLRNVSFNIPQNELTAIVGESGCGKSTFVSLLMKERRDYTGKITIGGNELNEISGDMLRRHITRISHDAYIFYGTLYDNLKMGNPAADRKQMEEALRLVDMYDTVSEKGGLDMAIEEKGANLSGGQKQRIAMARAILHDSDVYVFDEATSNVDVESENKIMEVVDKLSKTKTVIVIYHRLANVKNADNIIVLKDGIICEQGNHNMLIEKNGHYARLYNTQKKLETVIQ
jgi:ABC-type transport system involved in cytochrome bd biosynthesis fused ATPase/permease subunit